jgi:class 3 adenylate cyclase
MRSSDDKLRVRFSLRWKITLPFMFLALMLAMGAIVIVNRLSVESEQLQFLRQLLDSGQQATDEVVRIEERLLEVERAVANTEGVVPAVALGDAEELRQKILGLIINSRVDVAVILERDGTSLLTSRRTGAEIPEILRGEGFYSDWRFVRQVLQLDSGSSAVVDEVGEKQVGLESIRLGDDEVQVLFIAAPLLNESGTILGAVLTGAYLDNVVEQLSQSARTAIAFYDARTGELLGTTFEDSSTWDPVGLALSPELIEIARDVNRDEDPYRTIKVAGKTYGEIITPFTVRQGTVELGMLGVALYGAEDPDLAYETYQKRITSIIVVAALALVLVVSVGLYLSHTITRPLIDIAEASAQVAAGDLTTQVAARSGDEVGLLGKAFNRMVEDLREGAVYRSLLSRTMSPEMREELRKTMQKGESFHQGQVGRGTVLYAEIRGIAFEESEKDPTGLMRALNEYYASLSEIVHQHGGVVHAFDGRSLTAIFGILPRNLPPQVSALQAIHAGFEMLSAVRAIQITADMDSPPTWDIGVGLSTGTVLSGGLVTEDQMHYTVIGDALQIAEAIQRITRASASTRLVIDQQTYRYLRSVRSQFEFGREGQVQVEELGKEVKVYEVSDRSSRLLE